MGHTYSREFARITPTAEMREIAERWGHLRKLTLLNGRDSSSCVLTQVASIVSQVEGLDIFDACELVRCLVNGLNIITEDHEPTADDGTSNMDRFGGWYGLGAGRQAIYSSRVTRPPHRWHQTPSGGGWWVRKPKGK